MWSDAGVEVNKLECLQLLGSRGVVSNRYVLIIQKKDEYNSGCISDGTYEIKHMRSFDLKCI